MHVTNSIEKSVFVEYKEIVVKYDQECKKDNTTLNRKKNLEHFYLVFILKKSYLANKLTSIFQTLNYLRMLPLQTCFSIL